MSESTTSSSEASTYLSTYINKTLHLHTSDGRIFVGQMKCTDNERNIILAMTQEYRQPSKQDVEQAFESYTDMRDDGKGKGKRKVVDMLPGMKKRFVGLVVVPGRLIQRVECEG